MSSSPPDDEHGGSGTDLGMALDGVPEEIARDVHIGAVGQEGAKPRLEDQDRAFLPLVVGHRQPIGVGVDDRVTGFGCGQAHGFDAPAVSTTSPRRRGDRSRPGAEQGGDPGRAASGAYGWQSWLLPLLLL